MFKAAHSSKCFIGFLLLMTCAALMQAKAVSEPGAASLTEDDYDDSGIEKDNELLNVHKRPAFFVGSRYGRAGRSGSANSNNGKSGSAAGGSSKARRVFIMPRNDRFFLGSRYGKRAGEYVSPYEQSSTNLNVIPTGNDSNNNVNNGKLTNAGGGAKTGYISCVYTGIDNYYRCVNAEIDNFISQLSYHRNADDAFGTK